MSRTTILGSVLLASSILSALSASATPPSKMTLEFRMYAETVRAGTDRDLTLCLVNHGQESLLEAVDGDRLELAIPSGGLDSDLVDGESGLDCTNWPDGWECLVDTTPIDGAIVTLRPAGASIAVAPGETVCFDLVGVEVNAAEGLAFNTMTQLIDPHLASEPLNELVPVFKLLDGSPSHDDLSGLTPDEHHPRYTDPEAVSAVGPHFCGDHGELTNVSSDQHHSRYTAPRPSRRWVRTSAVTTGTCRACRRSSITLGTRSPRPSRRWALFETDSRQVRHAADGQERGPS